MLMLRVQSLVVEGHGAARNEYNGLYRISSKIQMSSSSVTVAAVIC